MFLHFIPTLNVEKRWLGRDKSLYNIMEGEIAQTDRCDCLRSMAAVIFDHVLLPSFLSSSKPSSPSLAQKLLAVFVNLALPLH